MALTKLVNGQRFTMDAAEEAAIQSGWLVGAAQSLSDSKAAKRADFRIEGVLRVAAQVPDWNTLDTIKTVAGMWVSHLAMNATATQITARDIYLYVRNTVPPKVNAAANQAALDAIDPTASDPFGDGTIWPT